jgi:hypothetical protein
VKRHTPVGADCRARDDVKIWEDGELKWRIRPVKGAQIAGSPLTDGRRIVVAVQQNSQKEGENAVVAIGEIESREVRVKGK